MSELKPCPFCGDHAFLKKNYTSRCRVESVAICCKNYKCDTEILYDTEDQAINKWNTRPHEEKLKRGAFESGFSVTREGFNAEYCGHDYQRFEDAYIAGISIDKWGDA